MPDRPTIGVTTGNTDVPIVEGTLDSHYLGRAYTKAIAGVGGVPVALPAVPDGPDTLADDLLDRIDGLMLAGGADIAPSVYGAAWPPAQTPEPARDALELALTRGAVARGLPVFGVCRGMQMINVALGGTLHEHVEHDVAAGGDANWADARVHTIGLDEGSLVRRVVDRERLEVLCLHHQAPDRIGDGLRVGARAPDGIVESVEGSGPGFLLGVLWHPEHMAADARELQWRLYAALVEAARAYAGAKR